MSHSEKNETSNRRFEMKFPPYHQAGENLPFSMKYMVCSSVPCELFEIRNELWVANDARHMYAFERPIRVSRKGGRYESKNSLNDRKISHFSSRSTWGQRASSHSHF